ncbi:MAG TPA: DUF4058 family protein [Chloroflexi bacterium]|nr:DUF4058 family protein [Chloroflexota bacterium]
MPSPFPGMDPYLEAPAHWPDVHQRLITYIADTLQPHLPPRYYARMGERVYVLVPPHAFYSDVLLLEPARALREPPPTYTSTPPDVTVDEWAETDATPVIIRFPPVEHREPYLEIVHAAGDEVVTLIEVLGPTNKVAGAGREQYLRKQADVLNSAINLVEIDLLSSGQPTVFPAEIVPRLPPHRYRIAVRRAVEAEQIEVYPIALHQRLPVLGVPLRVPDPDAPLDLGAVFTRCYDNGGYGDRVDYRRPPSAFLTPQEAAWADGLLRGRGLRD